MFLSKLISYLTPTAHSALDPSNHGMLISTAKRLVLVESVTMVTMRHLENWALRIFYQLIRYVSWMKNRWLHTFLSSWLLWPLLYSRGFADSWGPLPRRDCPLRTGGTETCWAAWSERSVQTARRLSVTSRRCLHSLETDLVRWNASTAV